MQYQLFIVLSMSIGAVLSIGYGNNIAGVPIASRPVGVLSPASGLRGIDTLGRPLAPLGRYDGRLPLGAVNRLPLAGLPGTVGPLPGVARPLPGAIGALPYRGVAGAVGALPYRGVPGAVGALPYRGVPGAIGALPLGGVAGVYGGNFGAVKTNYQVSVPQDGTGAAADWVVDQDQVNSNYNLQQAHPFGGQSDVSVNLRTLH